MLVDFHSLPDHSKIWVYQSSRILNQEEQRQLIAKAEAFVSEWTAHQVDLKSGVQVVNGVFLVFAVDESFNGASGCSIDKKVAFIKQAEQLLSVDFFNRMNFTWEDDSQNVSISRLQDLDQLFASGSISENTLVYNNLVSNMQEFRDDWKVALGKSWMMQFVSKIAK